MCRNLFMEFLMRHLVCALRSQHILFFLLLSLHLLPDKRLHKINGYQAKSITSVQRFSPLFIHLICLASLSMLTLSNCIQQCWKYTQSY